MKTILLATDFSGAAKNAADYGAQLSKITSSSLILFHSFALPYVSGETMTFPVSIEELEKDANIALEEEAKRLEQLWEVKIQIKQNTGFAADEIEMYARECSAELVVLGMYHRNKINQVLGSVATSFLHKNEFPTLIIPENIPFRPPSTFLFATDLHSEADGLGFDILIELVVKHDGTIHILNVVNEKQLVNAPDSRMGMILERRLQKFPHYWHFPSDGNVIHAISKTAKEISADWIIVIPHKLSLLKQLFHHSISSEITFSANYPILALPENDLTEKK